LPRFMYDVKFLTRPVQVVLKFEWLLKSTQFELK